MDRVGKGPQYLNKNRASRTSVFKWRNNMAVKNPTLAKMNKMFNGINIMIEGDSMVRHLPVSGSTSIATSG